MKGGEIMNKFTIKLAAGVASVALFAAAAVPSAFAYTGVDVSGNGAFSKNNVKVSNYQPTNVRQNNNSNINNKVNTNQNTGNNRVFGNVGGWGYGYDGFGGGSTNITTGDANASTTINNSAGKNVFEQYGMNN